MLDASDSVLDFGTVNINGADATQNISFTNAGTTGDPDITLSTANLAGSNAANFSIRRHTQRIDREPARPRAQPRANRRR